MDKSREVIFKELLQELNDYYWEEFNKATPKKQEEYIEEISETLQEIKE